MAPAIMKTVIEIQKSLPTVRSNHDNISATKPKFNYCVTSHNEMPTRREITTEDRPVPRTMDENLPNHFAFIPFAGDNITNGGSLGIHITRRK